MVVAQLVEYTLPTQGSNPVPIRQILWTVDCIGNLNEKKEDVPIKSAINFNLIHVMGPVGVAGKKDWRDPDVDKTKADAVK